ncbi:MAG: MarR family transcriptional regulator [Rhizobiales bacterium]|jgi:DNA-binding MarR family transcriptional regulator|nr:MarR family transcriptional regulator [Hyphomicrobiales bacterium]
MTSRIAASRTIRHAAPEKAAQTGDPATKPRDFSLGPLEDRIGFHLRLAQNASFKAFKKKTGEADLKPGWFAVLSLIHDNPGITPLVLSRASGRDKSTITPVLRDLLRNHLIEQKPMPADKRSYMLSLTDAGKGRLKELTEHAMEHDRVLDEIVGDSKPELLRILRLIISSVD